MKKYLLLTAAALLALPALNSCSSKPTGDPEKDAEAFQGLLEKKYDLNLKATEKTADVAEYYAENNDYDDYKDLQEEFLDMAKDVMEEYEDQEEDLVEAINKAEKKIYKNNDSDDDDDDDDDE